MPGAALFVWATLTGVAHTCASGATVYAATAPDAGVTVDSRDQGVEPSDDLTWGIRPVGAADSTARPAFSYELAPGEMVEDAVRVTNFSEVPMTVRLSAHDAFNTDTGGFDLLPGAAPSVDVGSWVTLAAGEVTIPAGEQLDVPFRTSVPSNAAPGDHAGGIVTSMTVEQVRPDGTAVTVDHRVGVRLYVRVAGPIRPALVVSRLETRYEPDGLLGLGGAVVTTYTVRNTGNVRLAADQRIEISGILGIGTRGVALDALPELLPGGEYTTSVTVGGVRSAVRLTSELTLSPTASPSAESLPELAPIVAATATWAVPWRALVIAAVAAAWLVWFRPRRRGRTGSAVTSTTEPAVDDVAARRERDPEPAS